MSTVKELGLDKLMEQVKNASTGFNSVNEVEANETLLFDKAEEREDQIYIILKNSKGKRFSMHLLTFCNMRVTDAPDDIKSDWSTDLRADAVVATLQDKIISGTIEGFEKGMKFTIKKRVKIQDTFHPGKPQLRPNLYKGFQDYTMQNAEARNIEDRDKRSAQFQANRMELYKSGVRDESDYDSDKNVMRVPVFKVTSKD